MSIVLDLLQWAANIIALIAALIAAAIVLAILGAAVIGTLAIRNRRNWL